MTVEGEYIIAGAGVPLMPSRAGAGFFAFRLRVRVRIPGSIGGAVFMNAGAYGSEMSEVLVSSRISTARAEKF
jgi:UDP-N-acetylmuramate dehydrogenase